MNYTKNYRLPQWVKSDRIMMDDFNAAMASMEKGMTASTDTANSAKADAVEAKATANAAAASKPYVTGSYTGTGETKTFQLGFKPRFVIISGMSSIAASNVMEQYLLYFGMTGGCAITSRVELTANGFTVHAQGGGQYYYPDFTANGRTYDYIAFK